MASKPGFFAEVKRRNVLRACAFYAAAVWALAQGIAQLGPLFNAPNWAMRGFVIAGVIGFPLWAAFAWFYEFTPEGLKRESEVDRSQSITHHTGRKLDFAIIGVLAIAVALLGSGYFIHRNPPASAVPAKSIAVLPFENLSNDKQNDYFVAGMQDLILTRLADIGSLKVISRTSTQKYKSRPENLKQVAAELGVATILEGSVQKAGKQVLVNVQLINAKTDAHLWAQSYTRTLDDIFGVEGEVADKIAAALNAKLSPAQATQLAAAPTTSPAAMDLFLRAEYQASKSETNHDAGDFSGWRAAIPLYRQAVAKDPRFALAYARLSYVESYLAYTSGEDAARLTQQARADAETARKLAPNAAATWLALGYCDYYAENDYAGAFKAFAAALALRPNDSAALAAQGYVERKQTRYDAALVSLQQAFALDPRNSVLAYEIGSTYMMVSRFREAQTWFQRALAIDPDNVAAKSFYPQAILFGSGDITRSLVAAEGDAPTMQLQRVTLLQYQRKFAQALALLDAIADTPDNFSVVTGTPKVLGQADLYRLLGDTAKTRPLYQQALAQLRPQLAKSEKVPWALAYVWTGIADAELGLGQTDQGLAAIASAQAVNAKFNQNLPYVRTLITTLNAGLYAEAGRADLAVPLLARALAMPGIGRSYSPVLLWLDPAWDPIRNDPRFQTLQQQYAKWKPAITYEAAPAASASSIAGR